MAKPKLYFGPEFIYQNIKTVPGSSYITQTLKEMEAKLNRKLPESFPLSLWMINFVAQKGIRQELLLPDNPREEASYLLGFRQPDSYQLKDSSLVRITDRPQSFMGIINHPQIDEVIQELRKAYDGRKVDRIKTALRIPSRDFAGEWSFTGKPRRRTCEVTVHVIYPRNGINTARDFEEVFKGHDVIDDLLNNGYKYLYDIVASNDLIADTFI